MNSVLSEPSVLTLFTDLVEQLTCRVGVIGLGYVGLPLAVEFAHRGFKATGFETPSHTVALSRCRSAKEYVDGSVFSR